MIGDMSAFTRRPNVCPVYQLDSVSEEKLEALILQLGLKKHSKTAMDPCCVICRQNELYSKQRTEKHLNEGFSSRKKAQYSRTNR